jgi:hypothetical protein
MHDDFTDIPADQQGKPRRVRLGDAEMVAVEEGNLVTLHKLRIVPSALWNSPLWRRCALPDWASTITDPANQFLVLTIHLADKEQRAIDALRGALDDLRVVRKRLAEIDAKEVVGPVDEIGKRLRALVEDLDR